MDRELHQLLVSHATDLNSGFSIGGFGAIAEFHDDTSEVLTIGPDEITTHSPHGALRIALHGGETALAYETRSSDENHWQYGLVISGAATRYAMPVRTTLTELGQDVAAIHDHDRGAILFDLGAGLPHINYCLRTSDRNLLTRLRDYIGQQVITTAHPLMDVIIEASPHRVVCSQVARIEVYQKIDRHQTPIGPHTHLLPDLLESRRTHSANIPIPPSTYPLLTVHPDNPLVDAAGEPRAFVEAAYRRFETLLEHYGDPQYFREKRRFTQAMTRGDTPRDFVPATSRVGRLAHRIALRQAGHLGADAASIAQWRAHFPT